MSNNKTITKSPTDGIGTNQPQNGHIPNQPNQHNSSLNSTMLSKPSTTIARPPRNNAMMDHISQQQQSSVLAQDQYVYQMGMARNHSGSPTGGSFNKHQPDDYDPDSNVYVANLPSDYGKDRLYKLFATYGQIVRYKFVTPDEPSQPGYGFVQFATRKDAHRAIKNLEGHVFGTGETIYLSIALRRRSSLSDEPTNLYVKNLPSSWSNEKLRKVFGAFGQIRQSKVVGDGIAFVRFEDHDQALNAIGRLDKQMVEQGCKLEVRFATRKTAANAYRLQQVPQSKTNENNLYIRNLPKYYNQSALETLFANYGKISSAKINDNGIAFVRFAHAEDARRAIQELNGKKPPQFEEEIVVKLAHFDIGDSRNRWANKFGSGSNLGGGGGNGGHFNNNMYQNHFNAPIGSMNQQYAHTPNPYANGSFHSGAPANGTPLPSVPTSTASNHSEHSQHSNSNADVNVNVNMNNLNASHHAHGGHGHGHGHGHGNTAQPNMMAIGLNNQMQAIQQQMQQWNIAQSANQQLQSQGGNGTPNVNVQLNQFAFPAATPVMMPAQALFGNNMGNASQLPGAAGIQRQISNDSHHSVGSGAASPQSNHSAGSNEAHKAKTWSKKQQQLGDQLYQKVYAKTGSNYAPKITGMLIKMGDKKAQQCIDDPAFLDEQIQIAKKLLVTQEGLPSSNGSGLSPTALLQQHSGSPTATTPLMNRLTANPFVNSPNSQLSTPTNRYQALNTKPVTPNANMIHSPNSIGLVNGMNGIQATTPNAAIQAPPTLLPGNGIHSIPNLLTSSIPNSLYGTMPIFGTPQLFAMSPAPASATSRTPQPLHNGNIHNSQHTLNSSKSLDSIHNIQQLNVGNNQQPQYLFTTIPNLNSGIVTSPAHQQHIYNMNGVNVVTTPNSLEQAQAQQATIQQSGWGLALNPQINVIHTQPATQFMQPALYPKTQ